MSAAVGFGLRAPRRGRRRLAAVLAICPALWLGCAPAPRPGPPASAEIAPDSVAAPDSAAARIDQGIPPDYLPPPGQCRVWIPREPAEEQARAHAAGRCSQLRRSMPEGAWLIYRPPDDSGFVRVWRYAEDGGVLSQRIHDAETGELLRHVAPAGS